MTLETKRQRDRNIILADLRRRVVDLEGRRAAIERDMVVLIAQHDTIVEEWAIADQLAGTSEQPNEVRQTTFRTPEVPPTL